MQRRTFIGTAGIALTSIVGVGSAQRQSLDVTVQSMAVETSSGTIDEPRHEIERSGTDVSVSGVLQGSSGCSAVGFGGVRGTGRRGVIDLVRIEDGLVCTTVMTVVRYELELSFDRGPPSELEVRVADQPDGGPVVRSLGFEDGDGEEHHDVERDSDLDRAVVSGTVVAPDACTEYRYAGTERRSGGATVILSAHRPDGLVCAQVLTPIDYELVLGFPTAFPERIDVDVR